MSRHDTIETLVREELKPLHLEVIDESHMHSVPEGAESHFKLVVVSDRFEGTGLVQRHRMINRLLAGELDQGLHALALHTMTPDEWFAKGGEVPESPECMGGSKQA
ncbi:MAG: BolA family protein [Chromatiales bacterium]|jgi:BolA protein